ncbi:MAG: ADP-ribosylglycohydrolase family protein [Verrucomicrobiota bacterium]|nr:ADP-ribosylglycohydrolase family protein [Verrucomicrobiota bacterium]
MKNCLPADYNERVYAGVLGKIIGVYLGRPFEGWSGESITEKWGEINRYVHEDQNVPLIVTDDDISGTFTFIRALQDHGTGRELTSRQIGQTWLNYIAEWRHILWWGGMGMSTEHTAFYRLRDGIEAPRSGSIELNGKAVAEEIGAQIFIDGWAMVAPNQPDLAARLASEAARVSHDGEALYGAVVMAVMESLAFSISDINELTDRALTYIPADCEIAQMICDIRQWRQETDDWREARRRLIVSYGYEKYGTNCPMVTNHGVIHIALQWGNGDFDRSLMIGNTCGFDTDCNSGNIGCLLGIRNGLKTLRSGYDWRSPVNDVLYLPSADGFWACRDAARIALDIANMGRALQDEPADLPKQGAKFPFCLPGATHGFALTTDSVNKALLTRDEANVSEGLKLTLLADGVARADVATFVPPSAIKMPGYALNAAPELYPTQTVRARVMACCGNSAPVTVHLHLQQYKPDDSSVVIEGTSAILNPGEVTELNWVIPDIGLWPIHHVGYTVQGLARDAVVLDWLTYGGTPAIVLNRPSDLKPWTQSIWHRMFQNNLSNCNFSWMCVFNICHDHLNGMIHTGSLDWTDYTVSSTLKPCLGDFGLLGRVRGLKQFYAVEFTVGQKVSLVRWYHERTVLKEIPFVSKLRDSYRVSLGMKGSSITVEVDGQVLIQTTDEHPFLHSGGVGLLISKGRLEAGAIKVQTA